MEQFCGQGHSERKCVDRYWLIHMQYGVTHLRRVAYPPHGVTRFPIISEKVHELVSSLGNALYFPTEFGCKPWSKKNRRTTLAQEPRNLTTNSRPFSCMSAVTDVGLSDCYIRDRGS